MGLKDSFMRLAVLLGTWIWKQIKPVARRVYIFFATPKTVVYMNHIPYYVPQKSEAQLFMEKALKFVRIMK